MITSPDKNLIHFPDKDTQKLQEQGAKSATEAGHPMTKEEANPEPSTPLIRLKEAIRDRFGGQFGDAVHVISTTGTILGGENPDTFDRTTEDKKVISISDKRKRLKKAA